MNPAEPHSRSNMKPRIRYQSRRAKGLGAKSARPKVTNDQLPRQELNTNLLHGDLYTLPVQRVWYISHLDNLAERGSDEKVDVERENQQTSIHAQDRSGRRYNS